MKLTFEWDANKEKTNIKKHGVSFVDAKTAFHDEYAMQFYDPDHSEDEDRFILLGTIISARHADASEQAAYWSNRP